MAYFRYGRKALFYKGLSEGKDILEVCANYINNSYKKVYYSYYYTKEMLYTMAYIL